MGRKLAFIRGTPPSGDLWQTPVYALPGMSPSHSIYDAAEQVEDEGMHERVRAGTVTETRPQRLTNPTATRQPRIGAQFSSLAAAHLWQGFANLQWSHSYPGLRPQLGELRTLTMNFNPNAPGRAEQQRATVYNPWPPASAIFPKAL